MTYCHGPAWEDVGDITHPRMEAYAKKCGARFEVIKGRAYPELRIEFEKFRAAKALEKFHRVLLLDTDIVVDSESPNLFEMVPMTKFAGWDECEYKGQEGLKTQQLQYEVERAPGHHGRRMKKFMEYWNGIYLNAGVWLFDQSHQPLFEYPDIKDFKYPEQTLMAVRLSETRTPIFPLSFAFNKMSCFKFSPSIDLHTRIFFHHITNGTLNRYSVIKELSERIL
jgi:lipopolysaccharide biosynthesis glycosyltransferase